MWTKDSEKTKNFKSVIRPSRPDDIFKKQMKTFKKQKGQTLIETAFVLFLLLLILLGITEFSRAWYTKNSIKNAARSGARVAVVTPVATMVGLTVCPVDSTTGQILCPGSRIFTPCPRPASDVIGNSVCTSPGVSTATAPADTGVSLCYMDATGGTSGTLDRGDTVNVCVRRINFSPVVPGLFGSFIPSQLSADASMRYE